MENRVLTVAEMTAMEVIHRNTAFQMANSTFSDEVVEELRKQGYEPILMKFKRWQYIAATKRQKLDLEKKLTARSEEMMAELVQLTEYRKALEEDLKDGGNTERRRIKKASC